MAALGTALVAVPAASQMAPELAPFAPLLDHTWKAVFDAETGSGDVVRWEPALGGQAIQITHSIADGDYGGVTYVMWDAEAEALAYTYFTTAGFFTRGTMWFDDDGALRSQEFVTGDADGVTEVRAVQELQEDGSLRVVTRLLREGTWEDAGDVLYRPAPGAEIVLPRTGRTGGGALR
jgi:hypothetical protein